jgi:predicted AAA+ superfamily ATPase
VAFLTQQALGHSTSLNIRLLFSGREKITLTFDEIKQNSYLAIAAISKYDKTAELSNVVHVQIPLKFINPTRNTLKYIGQNTVCL